MSAVVHSVRIKRKLGQDPLQALVVRNSKRAKTDSLVFKLAGTYTDDRRARGSDPAKSITLGAAAPGGRVFRIPQSVRGEALHVSDTQIMNQHRYTPSPPPIFPENDPVEAPIPVQLQSMIDEYIAEEARTAQSAVISQSTIVDAEPDAEVEGYVYDVYYGEKAEVSTLVAATIGYIELEDGQELLLDDGDEDDSEGALFVDDEDSNAEDFYRNDYPDEEGSDNSLGSLGSLGRPDAFDRIGLGSNSDYWSEASE